MPLPSPLPRPLRQRPFTVTEARAAGVSAARLRASDLRAPHRGVRVPAHLPDTLATRARVALLVLPAGSVVTGLQAARLCDLPVPLDSSPQGPLRVRVPAGGGRPRVDGVDVEVDASGWTSHLARCPGGDQVPVLHPCHVWACLAEALPFVDAVALADGVRRSWASAEQMRHAVDHLGGGRRGAAALRVLAAVRYPPRLRDGDAAAAAAPRGGTARTPLRTRRAGRGQGLGRLPRPELASYRVAVESDGDHHRTDARQWSDDISRRQQLEALGWRVVVVTAKALLRHPDQVVAQVSAALAAQGARW